MHRPPVHSVRIIRRLRSPAARSGLALMLAAGLVAADRQLASAEIVLRNNADFPIAIRVDDTWQGTVPAGAVCRCRQTGEPVSIARISAAPADATSAPRLWTQRGGWSGASAPRIQASAVLPDGRLLETTLVAAPDADGRTVVWLGAAPAAGRPPTADEIRSAPALEWKAAGPMEAAVAPPAPVDAIADTTLTAAFTEFYDHRGEWAGRYRIDGILRLRTGALVDGTTTAYVTYRYVGISDPAEHGIDIRTITIAPTLGSGWEVRAMGGNHSGVGDGLGLVASQNEASPDATATRAHAILSRPVVIQAPVEQQQRLDGSPVGVIRDTDPAPAPAKGGGDF